MKRIILIFLGLFSLAYGQFSNTGAKTRFVNGISLGTKLDAYYNSADSNAIYWRADSVLRAKYRGTARSLAFQGDTTGFGSRFIYNQFGSNLSAQTAKFWINDTGRATILQATTSVVSPNLLLRNTFTGTLQATITADRLYDLPNASGTIALTSDTSALTNRFVRLQTGNLYRQDGKAWVSDTIYSSTIGRFDGGVFFGGSSSTDQYVRTPNAVRNGRKGLLLSNGNNIDWKVYAGGNQTLGAWGEGDSTLVIGTGFNGGGGSAETVLFHSTGVGNMFAMSAGQQRNWSYFPLTVQSSGSPFTVNSTNSTTNKILFEDNGTDRGYLGASSTNALVVANSSGTSIATIANSTGAATFQGDFTVNNNQNATSGLTLSNTDNTNTTSRARIRSVGGTVQLDFNAIATLGGFVGTNSNHALNLITNGNTQATIATTGEATFTSSVTATGFIVSSDKRLKKIITRDGDVVRYTLKSDPLRKVYIGYIAQEVEQYLPETVSENAKGEKAVNYIEVLVYKVRQLEKEIAKLKKQINEKNTRKR